MDNNNSAATIAEDNVLLSDEMIAKIIATEEYMSEHPDEWISLEQLKSELAKI